MIFRLLPHPDSPSTAIRSVSVEITATPTDMLLTFCVEGAETLVLPERQLAERTDGLWKTTCFEMFLQPAGSAGYVEFNFSPSMQWAAYRFDGYRTGRCDLLLDVAPFIDGADRQEPFTLEIDLELDVTIPNVELKMGLSAVIEKTDGSKSYWALAHAPGPPDFHNRDCWLATLPRLAPT